jgi:hypothetical protein
MPPITVVKRTYSPPLIVAGAVLSALGTAGMIYGGGRFAGGDRDIGGFLDGMLILASAHVLLIPGAIMIGVGALQVPGEPAFKPSQTIQGNRSTAGLATLCQPGLSWIVRF